MCVWLPDYLHGYVRAFSGTLSPVHWGKFTVKETRVESLITQSDPLFIDQTAVRTAAHSFSLSQSVSHLTVCAQSNPPWNQRLAAIINELRWAWCLCPSLIVLGGVCLGCKLSLVKVLLNFAKLRRLVRFAPRSRWIDINIFFYILKVLKAQ